MRLLFDTSLLVAAVVEAHPHHARARPWLQAVAAVEAEAQIAWHAVAETWAVLTRLPGPARLSPATATLVVERIAEAYPPIAMTGDHYALALRRATERGLRSGAIFDALHLATAELGRFDGLVTFNVGDFERLRTESSPRIVLPPDPPAFTM